MKKIILSLVVILVILFRLCLLGYLLYSPFPKDGVWYCEELNMQASFNENETWAVFENGEKRSCCALIMDGSDYVQIYYADYPVIPEGIIFNGYCSYWDEDEMIIVEVDGRKVQTEGQKYTFVRVD